MPSRLSDLRVVDPVLTELALGYSNEAFVADALFPIVPVQKEAGKVPKFGKEAFKTYRTERAIGADPNRISPEGRGLVEFQCTEHAIEYPVDHREAEEDIFDAQQYATDVIMEVIFLRREKACADLAQDPNNYPAGNKIVLSGTSQFTDYSNSDPIGVIDDAKAAIRAAIGREPNTMLMGYSTYQALKHHPQLLDRIKYSMKGIVTSQLMQDIFEIEKIVVGKSLYAAETGEFYDLWQDNIILAYVSPKRNKRSPSFGYTFRKKGNPLIYTYDAPHGLVSYVLGVDNLAEKIVGPDAGYLIQDTNA